MNNHYIASKGLHLNYSLIQERIEENSKVLDLGCGDGELLKLLKDTKNVKGKSLVFLSLIISLIGIIGAFVFEIIIDDFYANIDSVVCEDDCTDVHEHITEETISTNDNTFYKIVNFLTDNTSNFNLFFVPQAPSIPHNCK